MNEHTEHEGFDELKAQLDDFEISDSDMPSTEEALELYNLKQLAKRVHEKIDEQTKALMTLFGANRFDYDLEGVENLPEDAQGFLKLEIKDNVKALSEGETVWKSTGFSPISVDARMLKTKPKSLK